MNKRLERMIKDVTYTTGEGLTLCGMELKSGRILVGMAKTEDMQIVEGVPLAHKLAYKDAYKTLEALTINI